MYTYSWCQILFVYFLVIPSLLHPLIFILYNILPILLTIRPINVYNASIIIKCFHTLLCSKLCLNTPTHDLQEWWSYPHAREKRRERETEGAAPMDMRTIYLHVANFAEGSYYTRRYRCMTCAEGSRVMSCWHKQASYWMQQQREISPVELRVKLLC